MAFLLLLERLTPVERAVFLLHDVFDYDYDEIAGIVGKSEANCRQLAVRARAATSTSTGRASRRRGGSATSWPRGSSPPSRTATSTASSSCSPRTSSSTATAAARARPGRDPIYGARQGAPRCCSAWAARSRELGVTIRPHRDQRPARRDVPRPARPADQRRARSTSPTASSRPSARSSTPTSSRHLGPLADVRGLMHEEHGPVPGACLARSHRRTKSKGAQRCLRAEGSQ